MPFSFRRWVGSESFWLTLLLGLSLVIRLATLGVRPFDGDEGVILDVVTQPTLREALSLAARDVHPLGLFALAWGSITLGGLSEWTARLVPALASVGIIWLTFGYLTSVANRRVAWVAAVLVAISPQNLYFSQELRFYSLLALLTLGSVWLLTELRGLSLLHPEGVIARAHPPGVPGSAARGRTTWLLLVGWALVNWLLLETQHLGAIVIVGQVLTVGWWMFGARDRVRDPTAVHRSPFTVHRFLLGFLLTAFLYLPTLPTTLHQFGGRLGGEDQTGLNLRTNLVGTINGLYRLGVGNLAAGIDASPAGIRQLATTDPIKLGTFVVSGLLLMSFLVVGFRALTAEQRRRLVPYLVVAGVLVLAAILSQQVGERASRNLYVLSPLYFAVLTSGMVSLWGRKSEKQEARSEKFRALGQIASVLLVGFIVAGSFVHFQSIQRPGVDVIAAFVDARLKPGDVVLTKGTYLHGESFIFGYYRGRSPVLRNLGGWCTQITSEVRGTCERPTYSARDPEVVDYYGDYDVNRGNLAQLNAVPVQTMIDQLLQTHPRVWFYDLIGDPVTGRGTPHQLGVDKEGLPLVVYEITQ